MWLCDRELSGGEHVDDKAVFWGGGGVHDAAGSAGCEEEHVQGPPGADMQKVKKFTLAGIWGIHFPPQSA